jgi:uncharacterized protein
MSKAVQIEISADRPSRAIEFYEKVFGWQIDECNFPYDYWLIKTGYGEEEIGAIVKRRNDNLELITIDVESIDMHIEKIKSKGGIILNPEIRVPGEMDLIYFKDSEGNIVEMIERSINKKIKDNSKSCSFPI